MQWKQNSIQSTRKNEVSSMVTMLILVTVVFVMLTLPQAIFQVLLLGEKTNSVFKFGTIAVKFDMLNHSINCILYCAGGRKFRHEAAKMVCGEKHHGQTSRSQIAIPSISRRCNETDTAKTGNISV